VVLASHWPHKRTDLAVQYLSRWQEQRRYAGPVDWVGRLPAGLTFPKVANWHLHGRLAPDDWNRLLAEAKVLVYFSDYEGFAMPPVEAALAGACPVYSDLPATREVMQGAGCCFANADNETFAVAMDKALRTDESQVKNWASQLLLRHTWQTVEERVIQALA
jgi:glycosyltransferase involved in cell wall biosynthesis